MNAGIVILADGTPCIVHDEALTQPIRHIAFDAENYQISLVLGGDDSEEIRKTFEYPVDPPFVELLREKKEAAVAQALDGKLVDIAVFSIIFT